MSINSSDLQVLVARSAETQKISTQKGRAGQEAAVAAGISQKVERERSQQRVSGSPKTEGGKVDKDGRNHRQNKEEEQSGSQKESKERKSTGNKKNGGHLLDITI